MEPKIGEPYVGGDHFRVELQKLHLFSLSLERLRGAVGRGLLSYTEGPWSVSHGGDIFRRFLLHVQFVMRARITHLPSPVT